MGETPLTTNTSIVELVDHMGSDLSVVDAARVSFDKKSEWDYEVYKVPNGGGAIQKLKKSDEKLINFLARENHWSPFGHAQVQFRITAPVFVARQLVKHQVGLVWNEVSRRYVDAPPQLFLPDQWRARHENKKQGSNEEVFVEEVSYFVDGIGEQSTKTSDFVRAGFEDAEWRYNVLLQNNVCPEQARMVLPQSMMTSWIWTGSLYAMARVYALRAKPDTQLETRLIALEIGKHMENLFPVSWKALTNEA